MPRPDVHDIEIMKGVHNRDSITEMAATTGLSLAGVHGKLEELEGPKLGYVNPPRKPGAARDRTLTDEGMKYLVEHGYLQPPPTFTPGKIFDT